MVYERRDRWRNLSDVVGSLELGCALSAVRKGHRPLRSRHTSQMWSSYVCFKLIVGLHLLS
ncbi:hypothetical protein BKA67DRAFT_560839 [Truncatella angustata]|uniref:Uncharacterized protein n=1 Tax=Truncatella angustata TaxID=152316 RepID=A0A9P8UNK6_9PEZI|nr:uncharacterized protein BKA67DRAFT_560839 [Truncatella angustata]KAH6655488.1 hypothetical protein BKA67DRAFT_560839 [Truncatella angustata]